MRSEVAPVTAQSVVYPDMEIPTCDFVFHHNQLSL